MKKLILFFGFVAFMATAATAQSEKATDVDTKAKVEQSQDTKAVADKKECADKSKKACCDKSKDGKAKGTASAGKAEANKKGCCADKAKKSCDDNKKSKAKRAEKRKPASASPMK